MEPGYNWHSPLYFYSWTPLHLQSVLQHTQLFQYCWFDLPVVYFSCQVWVFFQHLPMFFKMLPNTDNYKNCTCTKCTSCLTEVLYDSKQFSSFSVCHCQTFLTSTTKSYTYARFQALVAMQLWSLHQWVTAAHVFKTHCCLKMSGTII